MHEFMPSRPEPAQGNVRSRRAQGICRFAVASPCACPTQKRRWPYRASRYKNGIWQGLGGSLPPLPSISTLGRAIKAMNASTSLPSVSALPSLKFDKHRTQQECAVCSALQLLIARAQRARCLHYPLVQNHQGNVLPL